MADTSTTKKPFWKSKIVLFSGAGILVFGGNLLLGGLFRSGVTPDQIAALQQAYPQGVEIVERIQSGESITNLIGLIINVAILIFRGWFTEIPTLSKSILK